MVHGALTDIIILIATAVCSVAVFKRFKFSPVLGYLVSGTILGNYGLKIVTYENTKFLGEFGVVFLLFSIGIELSFERLKTMRKYIFKLGLLQVLLTAIVIGAFVSITYHNVNMALIVGGGFALSSTAIVLQIIRETHSQSTQISRITLAILLLQDFVVVPLLVIVPLLSHHKSSILIAIGIAIVKAIIVLLGIFTFGRLLLRPLFELITLNDSNNELLVAMTLLIAISSAFITEYFGLSLALGAFIAGTLIAETEFRSQAAESIHPFKNLLLGLFFMNVGMTLNIYTIYKYISIVLIYSVSLIVVKALVISILCLIFGFNKTISLHSGLLLAQGSEFAFALFNLSYEHGIISANMTDILLLVVTCTMALTPMLDMLGHYVSKILRKSDYINRTQLNYKILKNHVVIAGFGSVGKIIANVLDFADINYIAVDIDESNVIKSVEDGYAVFRADISHIDTLCTLNLEEATSIVFAINNELTIKRTLKIVSMNFPNLYTVVNLKNPKKSKDFFDFKLTHIVFTDYEIGLCLARLVLDFAGNTVHEINKIEEQFRSGNYLISKRRDNEEESRI